MEKINAWLKVFDQWHVYLQYCASEPIQAPICRPFWMWIMIGLFIVAGIILITFCWSIISYRMKYAAALRAQAAREFVDHSAINASKWVGDKAYKGDISEEEINRRIREAVYKHRIAESEAKDKLNVV